MKLKVKPAWHETFIRHILNGKSMQEASVLSKVGMERIYQERRLHPDFAKVLDEAREAALKALSW